MSALPITAVRFPARCNASAKAPGWLVRYRPVLILRVAGPPTTATSPRVAMPVRRCRAWAAVPPSSEESASKANPPMSSAATRVPAPSVA